MAKFWINDPLVLLSTEIIPRQEMTINEKLNALTRLLLIIVLVLYLLGYSHHTLTILIGGIILIVLIHLFTRQRTPENFTPEVSNSQALRDGIRGFVPGYDSVPHVPANKACWFDQNTDLLNATYEITPKIQFNHDEAAKRSYMNAKYELDPLIPADGFTQIWRGEPGMCGEYNMVPDVLTQMPVEEIMPDSQVNYITRTKVDHVGVDPAKTSLQAMRGLAEADFTNASMQFRDAIMNDHIDYFRRERQHNCPDMRLGRVAAGAGGTI